jgi:hypothetical protein
MKIYRRRYTGEPFAESAPIYTPVYFGTKDEAHRHVRENDKQFWNDLVIEEITVRDDKVGLIAALNGAPEVAEPANRRWGITNRGGLHEEDVE